MRTHRPDSRSAGARNPRCTSSSGHADGQSVPPPPCMRATTTAILSVRTYDVRCRMRTSSPRPRAPPLRASSRALGAARASSRTDRCMAGPLRECSTWCVGAIASVIRNRKARTKQMDRQSYARKVEQREDVRTDLRRDRGRLHLAERRDDELVPELRQGIIGRRELEFLRRAGHGSEQKMVEGMRVSGKLEHRTRPHVSADSMSNAKRRPTVRQRH